MIYLTDKNFEREINLASKPVLVDFFAEWCEPCQMLGPVLEEVEKELGDKIILMKVNVDNAPLASQMFSVSSIPKVVLFKDKKPVANFVGFQPKQFVKEWVGQVLNEKNEEISEMIKDYQAYAQKNGLKLNPDTKAVERIMKGLLANKAKHGEKYCPCRRVAGDKAEDAKKICPCFWHKEEVEKDGHCFCNLFVK